MTKSPRSTGSVSNTVRELQRAAVNDLMTALLRKFSAAQACTDRQLLVQTNGYVAAESVAVPCVFCDKHCMSDTIECSACNSRPIVSVYQEFSADGMVQSGSMRSHLVRCCPMCSDVVPLPRSPMWQLVIPLPEYIKCGKTAWRPGLRPGPRWGNLQRSPRPPSWLGGAGCPLPQEPNPRCRPFGPRTSWPSATRFTPPKLKS